MADFSNEEIYIKVKAQFDEFIELPIIPSDMTVVQLKENLEHFTDIKSDEMRLVLRGRIMLNDQMLSTYDVSEGDIVYLVRNIRHKKQQEDAPKKSLKEAQNGDKSSSLNPFANPGLSSFFKNVLSRTEVLQSILASNPQLREVLEKNPELSHALKDPSYIKQTLEIQQNPNLVREMLRNNDRALSNIEMLPGGFNHLRKMYHNIQEPLENAHRSKDENPDAMKQQMYRILKVSKPKSDKPNTTPLPNPWTVSKNPALSSPIAPLLQGNLKSSSSTPISPFDLLPKRSSNVSAPSDENSFPLNLSGLSLSDTDADGNMTSTSADFNISDDITMEESPEIRYREQLNALQDMGFSDSALNVRALLAAGGDLNSAIEWLLRFRQS